MCRGKFGQLGLGTNAEVVDTPQRVEALASERVVRLASGWKHSLAVTASGKCYSWGRGVNGELAWALCLQKMVAWQTHVHTSCGATVPHAAAAAAAASMLLTNRPAHAAGQLGHGDNADTNVPTLVAGLSAGEISIEALSREAHPVVTYSVPAADRCVGLRRQERRWRGA